MNQSREAHHAARPLHSPEGGQSAAILTADWPHEGHDQREQSYRAVDGYASGMRMDQRRFIARPRLTMAGTGGAAELASEAIRAGGC
jgi:hypothetical protein